MTWLSLKGVALSDSVGGRMGQAPPQGLPLPSSLYFTRRCGSVSMRKCLSCSTSKECQSRQARVYARRRQWQFDLVLCDGCWRGFVELIKGVSTGWSNDMWDPTGKIEARLGGFNPKVETELFRKLLSNSDLSSLQELPTPIDEG